MNKIIIQDRIYEIRGSRVMFDYDLAESKLDATWIDSRQILCLNS